MDSPQNPSPTRSREGPSRHPRSRPRRKGQGPPALPGQHRLGDEDLPERPRDGPQFRRPADGQVLRLPGRPPEAPGRDRGVLVHLRREAGLCRRGGHQEPAVLLLQGRPAHPLLLPGPRPSGGPRLPRADQDRGPAAGRGQRYRRRPLGARLPEHPVLRPGRIPRKPHHGRTPRRRTRRPDMPGLPDELAQETIEVRVDASQVHPRAGSISTGRTGRRSSRPPSGRRRRNRRTAVATATADDPGGPARAEPGRGHGPDTDRERAPGPRDGWSGSNRTISAEEEYINLMVEIVFLEEDPAGCRASLDALLEYHFDRLQHGDFQVPVLIIQKVQELGRHVAGDPGKQALLESFLMRTVSPKTVEAIKALLEKKKALDWESLLGFFGLLGAPALGWPRTSTTSPRTAKPGTRSSASSKGPALPSPGSCPRWPIRPDPAWPARSSPSWRASRTTRDSPTCRPS
ncbi:MAG: hypothetical protein M0C28_38855 [Candidatus Moduliflexus flocculans]|nr:hypothetical protein [Candidatus Moduliflexus flocculans]